MSQVYRIDQLARDDGRPGIGRAIGRSRRQALGAVSTIAAIAILTLLNSGTAFAVCVTDTWTDGNGNWSTGTNWSCSIAPSSTVDAAITDGTSNVTLSTTSAANNLSLATGNTVTFSGQALQLSGTSIANAGTLAIGSGALDILNTADTLSAGGTVQLSAGGVIEQSSGGQTLHNTDNTIEGAGAVGSNGLALDNQAGGTVNANVSGTLTLNGGGAVTNAGLLEATGSGTLQINNSVNNAGGNITASGGTVNLAGITVTGGTLNTSSGGTLQASGGTPLLNGVTLSTGSTFSVGGATTQLEGTITNNGSFTTSNGIIQVVGSAVTLQGGGSVQMSNGAFFNQNSGSQTLHNVDNTIEGSGQLGQNGLALDNQVSGTVNANISGATLFMNGGGAVSNAGLLEATGGGTLQITNAVTNTGAGAITANGGTVNLGAAVNGGTLNTLGTGVMQAGGGNPTLNGVTLSTGSTFQDATTTFLQGTVTNNGTITVPNGFLTIIGDVTLQGGGTVQMSSNAFFNQNSGGQTLHNVDNTIEGTGQLGQNGMVLDNQASGTVNANVNAGTLTINGGGTVTNAGLLEATNGGTLQISNTVNNTANITANTGSTVDIASTINGGTLNTVGTGVMQTNGGAVLNGVTLSSGSTYNVSGATTELKGTITNNGTFTIPNGFLTIIGDVTLQGGGTVQMQSDAFFNQNSGGQTLHNVDNTIEGSGQLGQNGIALDNQSAGTVNANVSGGTLFLNGGGTVTNAGLLEASNGGVLQINNTVNNSTNITANTGSTVNIASTINGGTLNTVGTGVMQTNGGAVLNGVTLSSGSTYNVSGGTTELEGTITNNGTFTNPNGFLTIVGSAVTLTGGGTVQLQSNAFFNQNSGSQTLNNVNNTIEGTGQLGQNGMAVNNESAGLVNANVSGGTLSMNGGGTVTNAGTLEASNGGTLVVSNPLAASTYGSGTITGKYIVDGTGAGPSNLQINALGTSGGEITTLGDGTTPSSITLNGTNANTKFTDNAGKNALALGTVNTNASLTLSGGYAMTTPGALSNAGTVTLGNATLTDTGFTNTGLLTGNGTVTNTGGGAVSNSGQVTATGGKLTLSNGVTGTTGNVTISNGASLDVSGATGGNTVGTLLHNGSNLNLGSQNITVSTDYNNANFGSGNSFNNHANVTGSGSILAAGTGLSMTVSGSGVTNGSSATPTLALGNVHVGTGLGGTFDIDWAGTDAPVLRGGVGSTSGLTVSNPLFGPISPGGSTPETVSVAAGSAGALSGQSLTIKPNFDNVQTQTIAVTGAAYDYANPVITPGTVALGNFHVHDPVTQQGITIANQTISNANFQEGLDASFGSVGSLITTNGGTITNLAAGTSNSTALKVGVNTGTAGAISQTATIALTSNGSIDGLASTPLTAQSVNVTAGVYNLASSSTISPVNIITRVGAGGGSVSQAMSVQNTAPTGAFSEGLDSSAGTYTSGGGNLTPSVTGTITNLAAGSTDSTNLKATIGTGTSGTFTGSVAINQASNGATTSGLGITSLGAQTVDLSGKVYQTAVASVTPSVSFGIVHVGDSPTPQTITVTNTASGALVDSIVGSMTAGPSPFSVVGGGSLGSGVTAGNNSGSALRVGLNTSTAGVYTGNANLSLSSHDSDLADVALTTSPVSLSGTVNNYAAVGLASTTNGSLTGGGSAYTLNLGTLTQGSGVITAALAALNAALGPADALSLGIDSPGYSVESGSGFGLMLNPFADLVAGDTQDNAFDVSLDTSGAGTFEEVIKFDGYGSNADYSDNNANVLDPTLTIEATVTAGGSGPPTGVPEPSSWLVLLSALAGLGGVSRPWRRTLSGTARAANE